MSSMSFSLVIALVMGAPPVESIIIGLASPTTGVRFAADAIADQLGAQVRLAGGLPPRPGELRVGLQGDPLLTARGHHDLGDEGFAWESDGRGGELMADSEAGLMYGLLDLAERLRDTGALPGSYDSSPIVGLRGDVIDLPMYLGCDLYDGRWRWTREAEADPELWFHSHDYWVARFRLLAQRRINAILIGHPHPFPAFIEYPDAPEAAYFPPEVVDRNAATLDWLIAEGREYGISLYFLTWNEWVPRDWAQAYGVPQEGPGTPESAALNRASYAGLFSRFPGLGGLVTMAGESPPGCVEFVRENVVEPLARLEHPPHLIFWTWCCYPEDVNVVLEGYPGRTSVMHYLQYEQLFLPTIDPRVGRMSRACGNRPVVVLGGPGTATAMLYWGSPATIRGAMEAIPEQRVGGVFFQGLDSWAWVSDKWIGWEALSRYHWDPRRDEAAEEAHWHHRIGQVLGNPATGPPLLAAYEAASDIPMRMLYLTHSQSDVFRPQYGLPLIYYLGMPTLSTYVFENHESIDDQGRLSPRLGLTWPNPDWGIEVVPVVEFVGASIQGSPTEGVTPLDIAAALEADADTIQSAVAELRPLGVHSSWTAERYETQLKLLTLNAELGRHYAAKVRAAVGWERWRRGVAQPSECLEPLAESVDAFRRYAGVMVDLYPQTFGARINVLTKSLPWSHLDLWQNYVYLPEYRFLEFADRYARELELIRAAMEEGRAELPFALDLVAPLEGDVIAQLGPAGLSQGLTLQSFGEDAEARVEESGVWCRLRRTHADFYFPIVSDAESLALERGVTYELILRYAVLRRGAEAPLRLSFGARTTEGGWRKDVGARYFEPAEGGTGEIRTQFTPQEHDDYYVYLSMNGDGDLLIKELALIHGR